MSTTTRPLVASTCPDPSSLISNLAPWTPSGQDLSDRSSDLTTSSSDSLEPETTGPRDITQKELNWSTLYWMS